MIKNKFKTKLLINIILVIILLSNILLVCAVDSSEQKSNTLYGNMVETFEGEKISIPIMIKNNLGFMGFSVEVSYDEDVLKPTYTESGKILSTGMYNDNVEILKSSPIKIVYTNSENVFFDGELFVLCFDVLESDKTETEIDFRIISEDSFDENWKQVEFNTTSVKVVLKNNEPTTITSKYQVETEFNQEETEVKSEDINTIIAIPSSNSNVAEVPSQTITKTTVINTNTEVSVNIANEQDIINAVDEYLESNHFQSISDISVEVRDDLVKAVNEEINQNCADVEDDNQREFDFEEIQSLYNKRKNKSEPNFTNVMLITVIIIFILCLIVIIRRERKNEES